MRQRELISHWQLTCIIIGFLLGTTSIISFSILYGKRDAWVGEIFAFGGGLLIFLMISYIVSKYPEKGVDEILDDLLPPFLGKIILLHFFLFSIILGSFVIHNIQSLMKTMIMQETPSWVFIISMLVTVGIIIRYGIEVFARCTEICVPAILSATLLLLGLAVVTIFDFANLLPAFTEPLTAHVKSFIVSVGFPYFQAVMLIFVAVQVKKPGKKKIYLFPILGLIIAGTILILRPVVSIGVFGQYEAQRLVFPIFSITRQIMMGDFLERVELFMLVVWFLNVFIKLGVCIFVAAKSVQYLAGIKNYKNIVLPTALIMAPVGINAYGNFQDVLVLIGSTWILVTVVLQLLPFGLIFAACLYKNSFKAS
ncbi:MAG: GerAB/ArcD/ProY family transporter [Peptococcaceae bacterium]